MVVMDEDILAAELDARASESAACRYYRVDLHVHSPGSSDFAKTVTSSSQRAELRGMSADEFVTRWSESGANLIAITDHNSGDFLDAAVEASKRLRKKTERQLTVLPGVELTVTPGVHYLAVFGEGGTAEINDLLSALKIPLKHRGKDTALAPSIEDAAEEVHKRGGLLIAAHCHSQTQGLIGKLDGQSRLLALRLVDALEISCAAEDSGKTVAYARNELKSTLPFVYGSDNHDALTFVDPMWVKMAEPSFEGIKQITFEPDLRISRFEPTPPAHTWIRSCVTTGGLYGGVRFDFSPNLNVLIGGRGAGKSALIDLLRFAFGVEPSDPTKLKLFSSRVAGFLAGAGHVVVTIAAPGNRSYTVVRSGLFTPDPKRYATFSEQPRAYQLMDTKWIELANLPPEVASIEFYAQGDVAMLADHVDEQLRLIDENIDFGTLKEQEGAFDDECQELEGELTELRDEYAKLESRVAGESDLKKRLKYLDAQLTAPIFKEYEAWTAEQAVLDQYGQWLAKLSGQTRLKIDNVPLAAIDLAKTPRPKLMERAKKIVADLDDVIAATTASFKASIVDAQEQLKETRAGWDAEFRVAKDAYVKKLQAVGAADRASIAEERAKKQKLLHELDTKTKPNLVRVRDEIKALEKNRQRALSQLLKARATVRKRRAEFVEKLNTQLQEQVRIDFSGGPDVGSVVSYLCEALEGSGMQNRQAQIAALCASITTAQLVAAIQAEDKEFLAERGKLTQASIRHLLNEIDAADLMLLERIETPIYPRIMLRREGDSVYSDLSELSVGEKCSAILSIALLDKDKPLVIDQPEDELDHAFVTESIVQSIRNVKGIRQIIVATHNPNIPVLGDAEIVFRVQRTAGAGTGSCTIKVSGGLELHTVTKEVQLLEGGSEAFLRRSRKYGFKSSVV